MKALAVIGAVLAVLGVAAWLGYRALLSRALVAGGRGAIKDARVVQVVRVQTAKAAMGYDGKPVDAGPESDYVLIDLRVDAPPDRVDFDDFQLVRGKVPQVGDEENVGDNTDRQYFYWCFVDAVGNAVLEMPTLGQPFMARVAFKVPSSARSGYLSYWGLYWGPLEFGAR
jgi:hypothetical protein